MCSLRSYSSLSRFITVIFKPLNIFHSTVKSFITFYVLKGVVMGT